MKAQIVGSGVNKSVESQVDPTHRALRISLRPLDIGAYGSYSVGLATGVVTAQTSAAVNYAFKWSASAIICRVTRVQFSLVQAGTAFTAGVGNISISKVNSFNVQYSSGANLALLGADQQRASRMGNTQQQIGPAVANGNIAISNTAALGTATPLVDDNPLHMITFAVPAAANSNLASGYLIDPTETGRQPLDLFNAEGFVVKVLTPATGTFTLAVNVDWDEIDQSRYLGLFT